MCVCVCMNGVLVLEKASFCLCRIGARKLCITYGNMREIKV